MNAFEQIKETLLQNPEKWLITGVAGFIGSNLLEHLLKLNQHVVGLDNFLTGHKSNLDEVKGIEPPEKWDNFTFIEGDIRNSDTCRKACEGVNYVLHQAALASVPRSIENPIAANENNVTGFLNIVAAAKDAKVKRFVYASSCAVYGDNEDLPKIEENTGKQLSPYALTKQMNEEYADIFSRVYGFNSIGLRYFNIFGPRQDPDGPYAAVIPKWFAALLEGEPVYINGDGETSRDFCPVENVVQANILAACASNPKALNENYNIACGEKTSLNELFQLILSYPKKYNALIPEIKPVYRDFLPGDIRHTFANISKAERLIGYKPELSTRDGLKATAEWYFKKATQK